MAQAPSDSSGFNIPIPDPSEITSREIAKARIELREEFKAAIEHLRESSNEARRLNRELLESRIDAIEKAVSLTHENRTRFPTLLDQTTGRLEKLFEEKLNGILTRFDGIAVQFRERDIRTDQDKIAASTAANAALQAQKEAAGAQNESNAAAILKSENSFTKEIDGLKALIANTKDSINGQIQNLTGRMDRGEGGSQGSDKTWTAVGVGAAILISLLTLVVMFASGSHNGSGPAPSPSAIAVAPLNPSAIAPR